MTLALADFYATMLVWLTAQQSESRKGVCASRECCFPSVLTASWVCDFSRLLCFKTRPVLEAFQTIDLYSKMRGLHAKLCKQIVSLHLLNCFD